MLDIDNRRKRNRANQNKVIGVGSSNAPFKAVKRYVDVYVGRLELGVDCDDITGYIKENFKVEVLNVMKLDIYSRDFNSFKVTVCMDEREKLFNADMWPQGVIVDKFYNRKKRDNGADGS